MSRHAGLRVPVSDQDHIQGPVNAPVTLLEYGDFECPHCAHAFPIVERLRLTLKDEMRLVFRNFPLTEVHPRALDAARAAEAAGRQDKFWQMHGLLFANRENLEEGDLYAYAASLGIDMLRFAADMGNEDVERKITQDIEGGARSGVNGTPTFFINGVRFDGDWSSGEFLEALTAVARSR